MCACTSACAIYVSRLACVRPGRCACGLWRYHGSCTFFCYLLTYSPASSTYLESRRDSLLPCDWPLQLCDETNEASRAAAPEHRAQMPRRGCVLLLLSASRASLQPPHAPSSLRPLHPSRPLLLTPPPRCWHPATTHRVAAPRCCEEPTRDDGPEEFDGSGRVVPSSQRRRSGPHYSHPASNDNRLREATQFVGKIRTTAALFAGFAYTQLEPPSSSDGGLLATLYSTLDSATLGFELVAVCVAQTLLYRLLDGTFGVPPRSGSHRGVDEKGASVLGLLVSQHGLEFRTVRLSFISGIICLLASAVVRAWCTGDPGLALPVTVTMLAAGGTIAYFARRSQEQVFKNL